MLEWMIVCDWDRKTSMEWMWVSMYGGIMIYGRKYIVDGGVGSGVIVESGGRYGCERGRTHQEVHDRLWDQILNRLPNNPKVTSNQAPYQISLHLLPRRQM